MMKLLKKFQQYRKILTIIYLMLPRTTPVVPGKNTTIDNLECCIQSLSSVNAQHGRYNIPSFLVKMAPKNLAM